MINTRAEWRKIKETYGIPDGVCSFSMGERVESWHKKAAAATTAKDFKGRLAAIEALLKDMKTYEAALKNAKPAKFKGKTPSEQATNLKGAQTAVHTEVTSLEGYRNGTAALANPMITVKQNLTAARSKLNSIQKNDLAALQSFYSVEYRNQVGKFVAMALTHNPPPKLKSALEAWIATGAVIDHMVDNTDATNTVEVAKLYAACKMGVEGLAVEVL